MKLIRSMFIQMLVLTSVGAMAQTEPPKKAENSPPPPPGPTLAQRLADSYKKPKIGAPDLREMQAMRGGKAADGMEIRLLAPLQDPETQAGVTVKPSPALYWFQNKAASGKIEIAITDVKTMMPVFKYRHKGEVPAGMNKLDLERHKVILQPGRVYKWSVIYHADRANPSANLVQSSTIVRIEGQVPQGDAQLEERAIAYSELGAWLDVTDLLATQAQMRRGDPQAARDLTAWLGANGITLGQ
jgi:hypothetical protein